MSAFLCSARHISAIVNAIPVRMLRDGGERRRIFAVLALANAESVDVRYGGNESLLEAAAHRLDPNVKVTTIEALKLIQSLSYQSCEVDEWDRTEAYRLLNGITLELTSDLPGYSAAAWTI